jgi:hypothetical protein
MRPATRARLLLARHPIVYWIAVAAAAVLVGAIVRDRVVSVERERDRWGEPRRVLVAATDLAPGDPPDVRTAELPRAAVPSGAVDDLEAGAVVRQPVSAGEVVVAHDVTTERGPAARASPGTGVIGIGDPTAPLAEIGDPVQVVADGVVLADRGTVVALHGDVVFVAVDVDDAAVVAAAAQQRLAALVFLP